MHKKLTALIIAHRSERTITACVQALRFCDRILVAVHAPLDRTAELAQAAGAEVVTVNWEGFGRTKNGLIDRVHEGWLLSIDADEVVTPELAAEIRTVLAEPRGHQGFWVSRRNHFLGREIRYCGWSPDWQLRLFAAGTGRFEERPVHEALRVTGHLGRLTQRLDHYSYGDLNEYLERLNTYTSLSSQERRRQGRRFSLLRLIFDPIWTFKKMFWLKSGWRDGFPGLALCALSALNALVKHAKLWEASRSRTGDQAGA